MEPRAMWGWAALAAVPVALAWVGIGCSSSSTSGGVSASQACADSAHAVCSKMLACTPNNLQATYGSEPACELRLKASCVDGLGAPSTGATPAKTEACAQAYATYDCADYRNRTQIPTPCLQVTGSRANGGACEYAAQCQSGFCAIVPGSACGACADAPKAGDSCAQLTSCGQGLTCATDTLTCTTPAAAAGACGAGQPCGAGLSCVAPGGAGTAGTCQSASAEAGAPCDGNLKTGAGCDGELGLYCDGVTGQCAQATYAMGGQPCGYDVDAGTLVECTSGTCQGADARLRQLGQCAARAPDEGACVVPDGGASTPSAGCLPNARCIAAAGVMPSCQVTLAASCP